MTNYPVLKLDVSCLSDCRDKIGEGVFWCPDEEVVYWLDVPMPSLLHRYNPSTSRHRHLAHAGDDHGIGEAK